MENEKPVVERTRCTDRDQYRNFMVFQPTNDALSHAWGLYYQDRSRNNKCITHYLKFSRDYQPVAFVRARSYDEVFALMNRDDLSLEELGIQRISKDMRSGTVGDVFSPRRGEFMFVTNHGFRHVPKPR